MMPSQAPGQGTQAALTCPWCSVPATPSTVPQRCSSCRRTFTLSAGPALDASVVPPPAHPGAPRISLRWSIVVTYRFAHLDPMGVTCGTLDPVIAVAPVDQAGVGFTDILSIAIWRKLALKDLVAGVLVPLPIALFSLYGAILSVSRSGAGAAIFGVIALVFGLLAAYLFHRGIVVGRRHARIVGRFASFTVMFDSSRAFHQELFRRTGLAPPPIP